MDFALDKALIKAGARSTAVVKGLLDRSKLQLTDEDEVLELDKQLETLKKSEDTSFIFAETNTSTGMSHEGSSEGTSSKKEAANAALRALFK